MRCLPGCVASAAYRCAAAPLRRLRAGVVCCFGGLPLRRCAASARAWCAASAAYGCALAGQKGRFPLDFHFVKVSPLSPAARRTSLRRLRRLRFAVFMRCLPGCAASAVGGRVVQSASAKSIHWIDS
ncbi:ornithine carbamoyltransferase [Mobiluncus mulieris]|uniref:ornithine carbamoyltransferase n=1 Tax=Mobiluncus mulieris TaxID=2052 RepID=UPI0021E28DBF|nr:ornithine carbamoyltransferase [Mobiluncus mulieris]